MSDLDAAAIAAALDRLGARVGRPLSVVGATASTNDDARRAAAAGAPHGAVFLADAQTAGRGRGGHRWHSPPGENLYLSVVLRPRVPAGDVAPIALAAGVAVASVLERRLAAAGRDVPVRVKWPNDVFAGDRKLSGVLVEGQLRGDRVGSLVVGVGVNVSTRRFPEDLAERATSLALLGAAAVPRGELAAEILAALGDAAERFEAARLGPFADEIARRDWLRGRRVAVGGAAGVAAGIDAAGRLLVRGDDGVVRPVVAGEVEVAAG